MCLPPNWFSGGKNPVEVITYFIELEIINGNMRYLEDRSRSVIWKNKFHREKKITAT